MTNVEKLLCYCQKKLIAQPIFIQYLNKYPSFIFQYLDTNFLDENEKQMVLMQKKMVNTQILQNVFYEKEIKTFDTLGLQYIGLKGYFIQKAYYPKDYVRMFGDIDIQTTDDGGKRLYKILINNGYKIINTHKTDFNYQKKILIDRLLLCILGTHFFKHRHHAELEKPLDIINSKILLDIHGNLFLTGKSPKNRMINGAIEKNVDGIRFKIFSPEDNLIFLMYHAIKHIGYVNLAREYLGVHLDCFLDVAQIITLEKINWEKFLTNVKEYNFLVPMISLFLKMFSDIYDDLIPREIICEITEIAKTLKFHWKYIYLEAMGLESSQIILGDYHNIVWLHEHCEKVKKRNINPEYIWIEWAKFYFKTNILKRLK